MNKSKVVRNSAVCGIALTALAGCIEKEKLVKIPDAENILFTNTGKLIVSGGKNIYQIIEKTDVHGNKYFDDDPLYSGGNCAFGGIAQSGNWVFTVCGELKFEWKGFTFRLRQDNHLMAADLTAEDLEFKVVETTLDKDPLDSLAIPNGIAFTPSGQLAIADENFFAQSSVGLITLNYDGEDPVLTHFDQDWLGAEFGVQSPNGVRATENELFVSDGNKVRKFTFDDNGNIPLEFITDDGQVIDNGPSSNEIYSGSLIIDDIMPYCGGIAVTHFLEGQLVYQDKNGDKYSTLPFAMESPSALAIGQAPMFSGNDLLVTEKGVLLEHGSNIGNHLTKVPMDFDLNDPATCAAILELD